MPQKILQVENDLPVRGEANEFKLKEQKEKSGHAYRASIPRH